MKKTKRITNDELLQRFKEITELSNSLDEMIALKVLKREYKHSNFYAITHKSIEQAYYLYKIENTINFTTLLDNIQKAINGLDADSFNKMLDEANTKTHKDIDDYQKEFEDSGLKDVLKNLKK